jgi:aryl-alcohol dehydrogenase-like predicted oxidoreductase
MSIALVDFGNTGFKVSRLGLGAFPVGQDRVSEKEAERLLNGVLDAGVNLIDTARGYGLSEERIGKYLAHRRSEFILSTKVGYDVEGHENWTRGAVLAGIERALRLLRTDVLDIVHLHSCDLAALQRGEVIEGLAQARQAGKIKLAAYSGETEALDFAIACGGFQSLQFSVNLCDQQAIDQAAAAAERQRLGVIAKRPIANAFWRYPKQPEGEYEEAYWVRAQAMKLLPPMGMDWLNYALRFTAFTPGIHTCILGTGSLEHFLAGLRALEAGPLPEAVYQAARQAFRAHDAGWQGQV